MASALVTAAAPVLSAVGVGGYHNWYQWLIATPHQAMAQAGSASATPVKALTASSYQKECRIATARTKRCWAALLQEIGKCAVPSFSPAAGDGSSWAAEESGASSAAMRRRVGRRICMI